VTVSGVPAVFRGCGRGPASNGQDRVAASELRGEAGRTANPRLAHVERVLESSQGAGQGGGCS
jgi:hypothetical protein